VLELADRFSLGLWDKGMRYGQWEPRGVEVSEDELAAARIEIDRALAANSSGSAAALLERVAIAPGAREAVLARAEVSAAATGAEVPAVELGGLARLSDEPSPGIAGGNGRLAEALAQALGDRVRLDEPVRGIGWGDGGARSAVDATPRGGSPAPR